MPATVTLSTTTLSEGVDSSQGSIKVASTSGLLPGVRLFLDKELMSVINLGVGTNVNVRRGQDGTASAPHSSSSTIYIGNADQFYFSDPQGAPPSATQVSPYINARTGTVWHAQGDVLPDGQTYRWWQPVTTTYGTGALGVRTRTEDPTSST